jgi:hypothetical protein
MELSTIREDTSCAATQEFPNILRNPKVLYGACKNSPIVSILSQTNPVHTTPSYSLRSILILATSFLGLFFDSEDRCSSVDFHLIMWHHFYPCDIHRYTVPEPRAYPYFVHLISAGGMDGPRGRSKNLSKMYWVRFLTGVMTNLTEASRGFRHCLHVN